MLEGGRIGEQLVARCLASGFLKFVRHLSMALPTVWWHIVATRQPCMRAPHFNCASLCFARSRAVHCVHCVQTLHWKVHHSAPISKYCPIAALKFHIFCGQKVYICLFRKHSNAMQCNKECNATHHSPPPLGRREWCMEGG